jgi:hypothetical protein
MKQRLILFFLALLLFSFSFGQNEKTIMVYFLYGSKPAIGQKQNEHKYFGGIHGGHVSIGIDTAVVGFTKNNGFHIFAHRKNIKGIYKSEGLSIFKKDSATCKYTSFEISVADSQYVKLKKVINNYLFVQAPYDYAFIGMRCASAAYDLLSQINLFKKKSKFGNIISNFYPKKLRKKMFKLAQKNNYKIITQQGRTSRKWEKD